MSAVDLLADLFDGEGSGSYLGEEVSIATHMLQAAALAETAGAADNLVAAALLHDVGHFEAIGRRLTDRHGIAPAASQQWPAAHGLEPADYRHQDVGADWLARWFAEPVTEPVRLHVMAKRYLCTAEPGYFARLSAASVHTLSLQGGPLTQAEAQAFERLPHAPAAIAVRRWDEAAKDPAAPTPTFEHFRQLLTRLARL